jgi:hypothetical protein
VLSAASWEKFLQWAIMEMEIEMEKIERIKITPEMVNLSNFKSCVALTIDHTSSHHSREKCKKWFVTSLFFKHPPSMRPPWKFIFSLSFFPLVGMGEWERVEVLPMRHARGNFHFVLNFPLKSWKISDECGRARRKSLKIYYFVKQVLSADVGRRTF